MSRHIGRAHVRSTLHDALPIYRGHLADWRESRGLMAAGLDGLHIAVADEPGVGQLAECHVTRAANRGQPMAGYVAVHQRRLGVLPVIELTQTKKTVKQPIN